MTAGARHFRDMADWSATTPGQLIAAHLTRPAHTRRGYEQDLSALKRFLNLDTLETLAAEILGAGRSACKRILMSWVNQQRSENVAANTIRRRVAAIRSMIELALDLDVIGWSLGRLTMPPAVRVRDCRGPGFASIERMMIACDERADAKGIRDKALLAMLYWHALRASEVLSIRREEVDLDCQPAMIRIVAKRGQGRQEMEIGQFAASALERWIDIRGDRDGPLFLRCSRKGDRVMSRAIGYNGLRQIIARLARQVGTRCTPHGIRHTAITELDRLACGSTKWGVALSRHKDPKTLLMYQDNKVSHLSAVAALERRQYVHPDPV